MSIARVDLSEPARLVSRRFATVCRLSPSPRATMRGWLRLPDARIEPGVISAVGDSAVRFGGGTLLVLQDRLLNGGANEGGAPSRSGRSDLLEHFEGVFIDLDQ